VIIAWDSIFHVPYSAQRRVVLKLCDALADGGVILFTAGGVDGEITGRMHGQGIYYSSLAEEEYLRIDREGDGMQLRSHAAGSISRRACGIYRGEGLTTARTRPASARMPSARSDAAHSCVRGWCLALGCFMLGES